MRRTAAVSIPKTQIEAIHVEKKNTRAKERYFYVFSMLFPSLLARIQFVRHKTDEDIMLQQPVANSCSSLVLKVVSSIYSTYTPSAISCLLQVFVHRVLGGRSVSSLTSCEIYSEGAAEENPS